MSNSKNPNYKFNKSGCKDMTAYKAMVNIRRNERRELITKLKLLANQYGYRIVSTLRFKELDGDNNGKN